MHTAICMMPYLFTYIGYAIVFILALIQYFKNSAMISSRYNKILLFGYYSSMGIGISLVISYTTVFCLSGTLQDIKMMMLDMPSIFFITIVSLIFLDYMVNSLYLRFESGSKNLYKRLRYVIKIGMNVSILMLIIVFSGSIYEYNTSGDIYGTLFKVGAGMYTVFCLGIGVFTICVTKIYRNELKQFPITLKDMSSTILLVIIYFFFQITIRIMFASFVLFEVWPEVIKTGEAEGIPYYQMAEAAYQISCNVISFAVFTVYLRKDITHLKIINMFEIESNIDMIGRASCRERVYVLG